MQGRAVFELPHRRRVTGRIEFELRPATGRTEVVRRAQVVDVLFGCGRIDAHPTHGVADQFRPRLRPARVTAHHPHPPRRHAPPPQTPHQHHQTTTTSRPSTPG